MGFPLLLVLSFRYKLIQNLSGENEKLYLSVVVIEPALPMDKHLSEWKHSVELIWSAAAPDYGEAACLVAEIARASTEAMLRQAAMQALPILRSASSADADHSTTDAARRRLGVIREVLHTLTTPTFGRRENAPKLLTSEERYRQMLGLPQGPRLSAPEIHGAWKRAAKTAHPDAGGSAQKFLELSAARDALIKQVRLARIS
jgi:hypothetical protein